MQKLSTFECLDALYPGHPADQLALDPEYLVALSQLSPGALGPVGGPVREAELHEEPLHALVGPRAALKPETQAARTTCAVNSPASLSSAIS